MFKDSPWARRLVAVLLVCLNAGVQFLLSDQSLSPAWKSGVHMASLFLAFFMDSVWPQLSGAAVAKKAAGAFSILALLTAVGCKDPAFQNAANALIVDGEKFACVAAAIDLGQNEPAVLNQLCQIAPRVTPEVLSWFEQMIKAKHPASAEAKAKVRARLSALELPEAK
jgi:hypothetical protein